LLFAIVYGQTGLYTTLQSGPGTYYVKKSFDIFSDFS